MKARLIFACAGAGIATFAFGVGAAHAETSGTIGFLPGEVRPGEHVQIIGTCDHPEFTTSPVDSAVLDAEDIYGRDSGDGMSLISNATVKNDAKPGTWPVSYQCGPTKVTGNIKVIDTATPEPHGTIGIQDREIRPGQEVAIVATCTDRDFVSAKVISSVLTAPDLRYDDNVADHSTMVILGRINDDAEPGIHSLAFSCANKEITGEFEILAKQPAAPVKVGEAPVRPAQPKADQVPVKPKGAPQTGGVGAEEEGASNIGLYAGAGAAVLLGGAGLGLWALRRRRTEG